MLRLHQHMSQDVNTKHIGILKFAALVSEHPSFRETCNVVWMLWYSKVLRLSSLQPPKNQYQSISALQRNNLELLGRVPPNMFTSWEFCKPRKITWKPENPSFQNESTREIPPFSGCSPVVTLIFPGFFPRFVGKTHHNFPPKKIPIIPSGGLVTSLKPRTKTFILVYLLPIQDSGGGSRS